MRIFWWQGGLHVEPSTDVERDALEVLRSSLEGGVWVRHEVGTSPIGTIKARHGVMISM